MGTARGDDFGSAGERCQVCQCLLKGRDGDGQRRWATAVDFVAVGAGAGGSQARRIASRRRRIAQGSNRFKNGSTEPGSRLLPQQSKGSSEDTEREKRVPRKRSASPLFPEEVPALWHTTAFMATVVVTVLVTTVGMDEVIYGTFAVHFQ